MSEHLKKEATLELEYYLERLTATSMGRRAFLTSVPLLMGACASSKSRHREGDNAGQDTSLTVQDEMKLTREALPEMRKEYPAVQDPFLQRYITTLGNRVVERNQLRNNPYQYSFTVVGVNQVNAFALPAGTVFVTVPLIAMAETEAELAGVVGHEVGHIKARHTAERMEAAKKEQGKSWLYGGVGGLLGGAAGFGLGRMLCPPKDRTCLAKAAGLGAVAGAGGGLLVQKFAFMANSREDEMEADRVGFRTAYGAGYHKDHVGTFYSKLYKMEQEHKQQAGANAFMSKISDALSTHPPSAERVEQMNQLVASVSNRAGAEILGKDFEQAKRICRQWIESQPKTKS